MGLSVVPEDARHSDRQSAITALVKIGYDAHPIKMCPSKFGLPASRPRIYIVAVHESVNSASDEGVQDSPTFKS